MEALGWTLKQDRHGRWMADRGDDEYGVSLTVNDHGTVDIDVDGALVAKSVPVSVIIELLRAAKVLP